jgi:hypothetical protein
MKSKKSGDRTGRADDTFGTILARHKAHRTVPADRKQEREVVGELSMSWKLPSKAKSMAGGKGTRDRKTRRSASKNVFRNIRG